MKPKLLILSMLFVLSAAAGEKLQKSPGDSDRSALEDSKTNRFTLGEAALDGQTVGPILRAFDADHLTLNEATRKCETSWCRAVVGYYLSNSISNPANISVKSKLPISRCMEALDLDSQTATLIKDYLNVYSNDWRGWKILGAAYLGMTNYPSAMMAYMKAYETGCEHGCFVEISTCALKVDRLDVVRLTLPHLLQIKASKDPAALALGDVPLDALTILLVYSMRAEDEITLIKALDGVTKEELFSREDLKELAIKATERFKSEAAQKAFRKLGISQQAASNRGD